MIYNRKISYALLIFTLIFGTTCFLANKTLILDGKYDIRKYLILPLILSLLAFVNYRKDFLFFLKDKTIEKKVSGYRPFFLSAFLTFICLGFVLLPFYPRISKLDIQQLYFRNKTEFHKLSVFSKLISTDTNIKYLKFISTGKRDYWEIAPIGYELNLSINKYCKEKTNELEIFNAKNHINIEEISREKVIIHFNDNSDYNAEIIRNENGSYKMEIFKK